jgi:hypothetical protein
MFRSPHTFGRGSALDCPFRFVINGTVETAQTQQGNDGSVGVKKTPGTFSPFS